LGDQVHYLWRGEHLKLFGITKAGLLATSIAVMTLWTCLAMERTTIRRANRDVVASLRTLRSLQQRRFPVSQPSSSPFGFRGARIS
jgi:hypothetical protein